MALTIDMSKGCGVLEYWSTGVIKIYITSQNDRGFSVQVSGVRRKKAKAET
jgi:hypothetical protein